MQLSWTDYARQIIDKPYFFLGGSQINRRRAVLEDALVAKLLICPMAVFFFIETAFIKTRNSLTIDRLDFSFMLEI